MKKIIATIFLLAVLSPVSTNAQGSDIIRGTFSGNEKVASQPLWVFSGAWAFDDQSFYLVDILRNAIIEYSTDGSISAVHDAEAVGIKDFRPTFIERVLPKNRFIVESGNGEFYWFSGDEFKLVDDLAVTRSGGRQGALSSEGAELLSTTTWTATKDFILAFGDIQSSSGDYFSGYAKIPFDSPDRFTLVGSLIPTNSSERHRHYLGYSFSAPTEEGDAALILRTDPLRIIRVDASNNKARTLDLQLSERFTSRYPWKYWTEKENTVKKLSDLESASVITNIIADDGYYYLVRRDGLEWYLERIDQSTMQPAGNARKLPVSDSTRHLVSVFTEEKALFVEKQSVVASGDQQIKTFFIMNHEVGWD